MKMKKFTTGLVILILVVTVGLTGFACKNKATTTTAEAAIEETTTAAETTVAETTAAAEITKKWRIAFLNPGLSIQYCVSVKEGGDKAAEELGVEVLGYDGQLDAAKQITQLEDALASVVDAVIFYPLSSEAAIPAVDKCKEAGVPIMSVNTPIGTEAKNYPGTFCFIGQDEFAGGMDAATLMIEALGEEGGGIIEIGGTVGANIVTQRHDGFVKGIEGSNVTILATQYTNFTKEEAITTTESLIQAHGDKIKGVYCHADNMAAGAIQALEEAGMLEKVKVIGIGLSVEGQDLIKAGKMYGTLFQQPFQEGFQGVSSAVKYLNGEAIEEVILLKRPMVTKENIDEYKAQW